MGDEVSGVIRLSVAERAGHRCENCLVHQDDSFTPHQIDHIVSRKDGGDSSGNLALACIRRNSWKGSDIASFGREPGRLVPLFHPRRDLWSDRFRLEDGEIVPLTETAAATVCLLRLNLHGRMTERLALSQSGRYPRGNQ
jgi:hypothetical protein